MLDPVQLLKLRLMAEGLAVSPRARASLAGRPLTLADYATTSGISLVLDGDIWVNAPLQDHNPNFVSEASPHVLDLEEDGYVVRSQGRSFPARPIPVPDYDCETNSSEEPYTSYAITHTDRVRISPIEGCGMVCTFCDLPYEFRYRRKRIDGLVDSVQRAIDDKALPAKHVLISGGTPKWEKSEVEFMQTVYLTVAERFPSFPVDIMMVPLPGLLELETLRAGGIHGLSINLEIYNQEIARKVMRPKYEMGLQYYLDFIEEAVAAFGPGRVRSLLIVGLEPPEDTLKAVRELASRGCDPVLSPFRPDPVTPLKNHPVPTVELLERVYLESLEIVSAYSTVKLGPRCIPCHHNTLTFPDGSDAYYYS
ncbi:MAG TPA: radical SAM protein [Thermoanaerobaculia bacterium]|nr:radical SAM protein [Thermoanaerobaculia bacterium]